MGKVARRAVGGLHQGPRGINIPISMSSPFPFVGLLLMAAGLANGQDWILWAIWGLVATGTVLGVILLLLYRDYTSEQHTSPHWLWALISYGLFAVNVKGCQALLARYGNKEAPLGEEFVPEVKFGDWVFNLIVFVAPVILLLGTLISSYYRKRAQRQAVAERRWLQGTGPRPDARSKRSK